MRLHGKIASLFLFPILISLTGCGGSASSTPVKVNEWTWVSGANSLGSNFGASGVYGTLGVAAAGNVPGGRESAVTWIDSNGKLWLFGGLGLNSTGFFGYLNDLWEYDPATTEWTWISGTKSLGSNYSVIGVYGTLGVAGAGNVPGGRESAVGWTDSSGKLWLFGGSGYDSAGTRRLLNDLWEFDPATTEWTWVSGTNTVNPALGGVTGVYGTRGVASATNAPGGRFGGVSWIDSSGNLWLFGGSGFDSVGNDGLLNDLWEFNPVSKEWTWVSGANAVDPTSGGVPGVYGTLGVAAVGNLPGGRESAVTWIDSNGDRWLFGGDGFDSVGNEGDLNDLWKFNPANKEWTWVSGTNSVGSNGGVSGVYGTLGVATAGNTPGGRAAAVSWIDSNGTLWLFGGYGFDSVGNDGDLNDLWEFNPATKEWTWVNGAKDVGSNGGASGVYGTLGVAAASNLPGGRESTVSWTDSSGNLWLFGGLGYDSAGAFGILNDLWKYQP